MPPRELSDHVGQSEAPGPQQHEQVEDQVSGFADQLFVSLADGGQRHLEAFLAAWDHTLMALAKLPEEDLLQALLEAQLRKRQAQARTPTRARKA